MRVLIDTNVLISAVLNAHGVPYQAFVKAASPPCEAMICEQNVDEMLRVFNQKFPRRLASLAQFLATALASLEFIPIPTETVSSEALLRDVDDRLILRAAIAGKADVILTGDKDFLESNIQRPMMMTPSQFLLFSPEQL